MFGRLRRDSDSGLKPLGHCAGLRSGREHVAPFNRGGLSKPPLNSPSCGSIVSPRERRISWCLLQPHKSAISALMSSALGVPTCESPLLCSNFFESRHALVAHRFAMCEQLAAATCWPVKYVKGARLFYVDGRKKRPNHVFSTLREVFFLKMKSLP